MSYQILADAVIFVHLIWIIFMLVGFFITLYALAFKKSLLDWWKFRTLHLVGIFYVAGLSVLGKYCPLTILENKLREQASPQQVYQGSFISHYLEKIVYPEIDPLWIQIPTLALAIFTILIFVLFPPLKIKQSFKKIL
ncbi:MAG: hypothetical protein RBG1_1C00001G0619 [candidate division Zixibacteria bacterium RBG-1]|nr:MAG: hypothetical protein RBG1_1C00001G0619 [candidate division Zixibacteria bacterium RBG-1]OGC85857.1 MAG: hypothetical protein A2V73_07845 [candidate division Zixibacteria bacterium RBG_19FT_COMBO_42_43]